MQMYTHRFEKHHRTMNTAENHCNRVSPPLVSILIPCYNAERWIGQAIESAIGQTLRNVEIIVLDDGSEDSSLDIIKSYGDRIRWESSPNRGGNVARNQLLELSSGIWLQYLDADDYLLPGKIEHQIDFVQSNPATDVIYGPSLIERWDGGAPLVEELPIPEPRDPWVLLARWFLPQTGSPLWRRQAIIDAGGWREQQPCCQEHELYFRLLVDDAQFEYCPHAESVYRKWGDETVCTRDPKLVLEQRLLIENHIEAYLDSVGELTPRRRSALNQARFEIARSAWTYDRDLARATVKDIHRSNRVFCPSGEAGPALYSFAYRTLGFGAAERLASVTRRLRRTPTPTAHA